MIIRKGTYGTYERPCIWIIDEETHQQEFILLHQFSEEDSYEYALMILARIEYCLKHGIELKVEGFRTDKEKYPEG